MPWRWPGGSRPARLRWEKVRRPGYHGSDPRTYVSTPRRKRTIRRTVSHSWTLFVGSAATVVIFVILTNRKLQRGPAQ
jgi:hypothetical protein